MATPTPITVAHGDGIGPEIMAATLHILEEAGAALEIETIDVGEKVYLSGNTTGIAPGILGVAAAHQGFSQGSHHHAARRRIQEPQRHHAQDAGTLCQHPAVRFLSPLRPHQASGDGRGGGARERRGSVRRHRVPDHARGDHGVQADHAAGQREDRPLRVRIRDAVQSQEGHLLHQGQHPEDDRRQLPQDLSTRSARNIRSSKRNTGSSISARPSWPTLRKRST